LKKERLLFPRSLALRKGSHFQYVFRKGRKVENGSAVLYFAKALEEKGKAAFVASKKVGGAVDRNRCKRRMKEFYRTHRIFVKDSVDLVFSAKPPLGQLAFGEMKKEIQGLLSKAALLKE
jgi:ribonuclease P protein component